jgi:hypothetical protein
MRPVDDVDENQGGFDTASDSHYVVRLNSLEATTNDWWYIAGQNKFESKALN